MATFGRLSAGQHTRESKPSYYSEDWGSSTEDHMELKVLTKRSSPQQGRWTARLPFVGLLSAWYRIILSVISGRGPVGRLGQ